MTEAIERQDWEQFIDVTPASTATYVRMGEGFTEVNDSRNPDVSEKKYISSTSAYKRVRGYAPEWSVSGDALRDGTSGAITFIRTLGITEATGADCETTLVEFDINDLAVDLTVDAVQYPVVIAVESVANGAGGEEATFSATIHGNGDPVSGTFDTTDNTFTADAS